ncbi:MAG: transposase [Woeseiaceae bacterium]
MRAKANRDLIVKAFVASNKQEEIITIQPNKTSKITCKEKGISIKPLTLRLVRVDLKNEVEVLITNLTDLDKYDVSLFKLLYHLRWGVEENYKRLKQWVEIEIFSGKSALSIQQDFYEKIVATNLTALMAIAAQKTADKVTKKLKLKYQINFAQTLSKMKHRIVQLILQANNDIILLVYRMIRYISKTIESVRDGRAAPRRLKKIKNDIHFTAYKSAL